MNSLQTPWTLFNWERAGVRRASCFESSPINYNSLLQFTILTRTARTKITTFVLMAIRSSRYWLSQLRLKQLMKYKIKNSFLYLLHYLPHDILVCLQCDSPKELWEFWWINERKRVRDIWNINSLASERQRSWNIIGSIRLGSWRRKKLRSA